MDIGNARKLWQSDEDIAFFTIAIDGRITMKREHIIFIVLAILVVGFLYARKNGMIGNGSAPTQGG